MKAGAQSQQKHQALFKKLRNNFKLTKQRIKQSDNNRFTINLKSSSMIEMKILDDILFKQLYYRIKQLSYIQITKAKFEEFAEMIQAKIAFFREIILTYRTSLHQYLRIRDKTAVSEIQIVAKEQRKMVDFMLPWTVRFLDLYYEKARKQPIKLSQATIDAARINFDRQITHFLKQEIEKLMPVNNESFKKHHFSKVSRKQEYDLYYQEKDFIDQIMYKIRQIDQSYNPFHKENKKISSALPHFFDQMKQNPEIQQFVPTKCVNCIQFFYKEVPFHDECNSLVDYELVPSVKSIKKTQEKDKILENITAFLNRGNGTLLFDCEPTPFGFVPIGYQMTLKEQQAYKYSFENLFKYIREQLYQKSIESEIDFIPLKKNPSKSSGAVIMDPRQPYVQRDYEQNFYVMRVRLKAKIERQFYGCQIDFKTYYYLRKKRKNKQVEGEQVYEQNQKKALNYYRLSNRNQVDNMEIGMKNKTQLGEKQFHETIKGQRQYRKNLHEGQCKQTRILSAKSNTKQQNLYQLSGRKY